MKNIFNIAMFALLIFTLNACSSQNNVPSEKVTELLKSGEFTFMAERANPTNYDVINVMNSLPNSSSSRFLNLDYGYTLEIKKEEINSVLPYFGRMFTPSFDRNKDSYRFVSKDFTVSESNSKKSSSIYTIVPKDLQYISKIVLEVFPNGKSYLSISGNDRQPISYDGYIMKNEIPKK